MAQRKKLLFLGRQDADTGFKECQKIAQSQGWNLEVISNVGDVMPYIEKSNYVFAGGYLAALEALLAKKIVLVSYTNKVKKDYWMMHPMAQHFGINGSVPDTLDMRAHKWAKQQTWEKLAGQYEKLWEK